MAAFRSGEPAGSAWYVLSASLRSRMRSGIAWHNDRSAALSNNSGEGAGAVIVVVTGAADCDARFSATPPNTSAAGAHSAATAAKTHNKTDQRRPEPNENGCPRVVQLGAGAEGLTIEHPSESIDAPRSKLWAGADHQ
jgi:hypothetical protein